MEGSHGELPVKMIECPRDAMQGWETFIPTHRKVAYLNALLQVGFDTLDFGSFVSAKAIPQMADTPEVIRQLKPCPGTRLLAIVANERGAGEAASWESIACLGYPFSISETFQRRNTRHSIAQSLEVVKRIRDICQARAKQLVIYISMGFGNPYGDPYDTGIVLEWAEKLSVLGAEVISLADTVGVARPEDIAAVFSVLIPGYPQVEFGAHFHSAPGGWRPKIAAAYDQGCRRFDSAIYGIGGCPMANDTLVGNIATENILDFLGEHAIPAPIDRSAFAGACEIAREIFR